jgi:sugar-specific transcriptional regulator TrmB
MDLLNSLKNIGFTQQEGIIYIALCKNGELTGYEAAKLSGISRSNAYAALSNLVEKGYAHIIEGTSSKYLAVPKEELINNATRDFNHHINIINTYLDYTKIVTEPYITITGEANIINKLKNIIESAHSRIYLSCNEELIDLIEKEITDVLKRSLKVVLLSPKDIDTTYDHIYYKTNTLTSFKIISDTKEVLAGTLSQSLYSKNVTLVSLIRESFINEIEVFKLNN